MHPLGMGCVFLTWHWMDSQMLLRIPLQQGMVCQLITSPCCSSNRNFKIHWNQFKLQFNWRMSGNHLVLVNWSYLIKCILTWCKYGAHLQLQFILIQVPKNKCLGYNARNESMGHHIQCHLHVWFDARRFWGSPVLQAASGSSMGHLPVLPLWSGRPELHLLDYQPLWLPCEHHHYHDPEVCKHCCVVTTERQSLIYKAMGECLHGL